MPAGVDGNRGQRAARRIAGGALSGGVCVFAGAIVYSGLELDVASLSAIWTEAELPAALKNLALAALAVLGTVLVSIGAVFALLGRTGVLALAAASREEAQEPKPRRAAPPPVGDPPRVPQPAPARPVAATRPALGGSAQPAREEQRPEPVLPVAETAPPPPAVEPPRPAEPQPGDLIAAWDDYRRGGDGHFNRRGLQEALDQRGLAAAVRDGREVEAGGTVLLVETPSGRSRFWVLPSFNKSPRAVAAWFDDSSDGALTGRTQRVTAVAQGRWAGAGAEAGGGGFEVVTRGEVA